MLGDAVKLSLNSHQLAGEPSSLDFQAGHEPSLCWILKYEFRAEVPLNSDLLHSMPWPMALQTRIEFVSTYLFTQLSVSLMVHFDVGTDLVTMDYRDNA